MSIKKEVKATISHLVFFELFSRYPIFRRVVYVLTALVVMLVVAMIVLMSRSELSDELALEYLPHAYEALHREGNLESITSTRWICYDYMPVKGITERSCIYFSEYQITDDSLTYYAVFKITDGTDFEVFESAFWT